MATMAPSAERGPTMKRLHGLDHHINAAALFQQVDLGEQQHNQQDGGATAPSMPSMMRPPALRGSGTEMMSLKVMVPVTSPRSTPVTMP